MSFRLTSGVPFHAELVLNALSSVETLSVAVATANVLHHGVEDVCDDLRPSFG